MGLGLKRAARASIHAMRQAPTVIELTIAGDHQAFGIRTDVTKDELLQLYRMAKRLNGGVAVEVGSYLGASACFLAAGCRVSRSHLYCVDTWNNDAMSEGSRDTFEEFVTNTSAHRERITTLRGLSAAQAARFTRPVSLLFVDGDHSRDAVFDDLRAWLPHLAPFAWLAMHDVGWAEGVQAAIAELIEPIRVGPVTRLPNLYCAQVGSRS